MICQRCSTHLTACGGRPHSVVQWQIGRRYHDSPEPFKVRCRRSQKNANLSARIAGERKELCLIDKVCRDLCCLM
jgi:hypothetical protein